jgi:hypothetical protein
MALAQSTFARRCLMREGSRVERYSATEVVIAWLEWNLLSEALTSAWSRLPDSRQIRTFAVSAVDSYWARREEVSVGMQACLMSKHTDRSIRYAYSGGVGEKAHRDLDPVGGNQ